MIEIDCYLCYVAKFSAKLFFQLNISPSTPSHSSFVYVELSIRNRCISRDHLFEYLFEQSLTFSSKMHNTLRVETSGQDESLKPSIRNPSGFSIRLRILVYSAVLTNVDVESSESQVN